MPDPQLEAWKMKTSKPITGITVITCRNGCGNYAATMCGCPVCYCPTIDQAGLSLPGKAISFKMPVYFPGYGDKTAGKGRKPKEPNDTEARWPAMNPGKWIYEALKLKISGGKYYTPDWYQAAFNEDILTHPGTVVECKPAGRRMANGKIWRERSYERSRLAFLDAQERHPEFRFLWVEWNGRQWVEK